MTPTLYKLKIRTTSYWLGHQRTRKNIRIFRKDKDGKILIDLPQWNWTFKQAIAALHIPDTNPDCIRLESAFFTPRTVLYTRNYSYKGSKQTEDFEAIPESTVLEFNVLITDKPLSTYNKETQPPSKDQLMLIFKFIGNLLGFSPWGSHFGYGRFDIESLEEI